MEHHMERFTDDTGFTISIGCRVSIITHDWKQINKRSGVVVGLDTLDGRYAEPEGTSTVYVRLDGEHAILTIHPSCLRVTRKATA